MGDMSLDYINDDFDDSLDEEEENMDESDDMDTLDRNSPQHPDLSEERIQWQEQIRMIHLRRHLNELWEKVKQAQYLVDKTKEELKKCRTQIELFEVERDNLFQEINKTEDNANKSSIFRLRTAHERVCTELDAERKLEAIILERLEEAQYDLALADVERGKFILAEDDLLQREDQLKKEKTEMAFVRLQKEEDKARQAVNTVKKDARMKRDFLAEAETRHQHLLKEAENSQERAKKYLSKTLEKLRKREKEEEIRSKSDLEKRMGMLLKLKSDIANNRDNLKAIRARDKALSQNKQEVEDIERVKIAAKGGNADEFILQKKRKNEMLKKKEQFEADKKAKTAGIVQKILSQEKYIKRRKEQNPELYMTKEDEKKLRVGPHPLKPLKILNDFIETQETEPTPKSDLEETASLVLDEAAEHMEEEHTEKIESPSIKDMTTTVSESSSTKHVDVEIENLAQPEFEGLWNAETKVYALKDNELETQKPIGASTMEKDILKRNLTRLREGIVTKQIVCGKEFKGAPFYSNPDVIRFKDFVVGKTYKKKVSLTNVTYTINSIKYLDITEHLKDFVKIKFDTPGQMSAGLTCEMLVTFSPMLNKNLNGEVMFLTENGPFNIPIVCSTKKCDLGVDLKVLNFGTSVIGETLRRTFTLSNKGALGTRFQLFKVSDMKEGTSTPGTSLGKFTSASSRVLTPEGDNQDKSEKVKTRSTLESSVVAGQKLGEEEGGEHELKTEDGEEVAELKEEVAEEELSQIEQDIEITQADLDLTEMEDLACLDGFSLGSPVTGEIGPFSTIKLEVIWKPTIPGKVDSEFLLTFADPMSKPITINAVANAVDLPVWVERSNVDLKICMFDRLYQDTIIVYNRASTALRLQFEVCPELLNHMELLPKTGYIQTQSKFSAQLKFLPRKSLFTEASKFFDKDTGVLEVPMTIQVADQITPVVYTIQAVLTNSDLCFDTTEIDFGFCTTHESVIKSVRLTNNSILPQEYGFMNLPKNVEVQPNDGFGTLLPLETIDLDIIFSPSKAKEYDFELVCKSLINRDFRISCKGVGVLTPLELSKQVIHFAATPLYDVTTATLNVVNNHTSSNEFTHPVPRIGSGEIGPVGPTSFEFMVPKDAPLTICPRVGTVLPGKKFPVRVRFHPTFNDEEVREEAFRLQTIRDTILLEKQKEEAERQAQLEKEKQEAAGKLSKKDKGSKTSKISNSVTSVVPSTVSVETSLASKPSLLSKDSLEFQQAVTSLCRQFKNSLRTYVVPCHVAYGTAKTPGELKYSIHNTLYVEVHCPVIKPPVMVISNGGRRTVDFGSVSIGQTAPQSVTIQNISDKDIELKSTLLNPSGPFVLLNAMRALAPGAFHTMLFTFSPTQGQVCQEELGVKVLNTTLHLTLKGYGVSPLINLSVPDGVMDMNAVLVGEYVENPFTIENTSELAIDYVIKQDSLSPLRHQKAQMIPAFYQPENPVSFVGTQNYSGKNVFDIVPTKGRIEAGEVKEIMVTFAPDHESNHCSDGIRIELFDQKESHFFKLVGQAKSSLMFLEGTDPLTPDVESLSYIHVPIADEDEPPAQVGQKKKDKEFKGFDRPVLLTFQSVMQDDSFNASTREITVGCVRTLAVSQKKNGEFSIDGIQNMLQKGFTIEPHKSMIEAGTRKQITITWTPPLNYDPTQLIEEHCTITLKCDVTETIPLMIRAMVISG